MALHYRNFRLNLVLRIALIVSVIFLIFISLYVWFWPISALILSILLVIQLIELVRYVDKLNKDLSRFLMAVQYRDYSQTFSAKGFGKSFKELSNAYTHIISEFQKISIEKESHHQYLQTVVEHVGTGLISFDEEGEVHLMNNAAKKLFALPYLKNIRSIDKISEELCHAILSIQPGENKLVKISLKNEVMQLSLYTTGFKLLDKNYTLLSLQNIKTELDEQELDAWQKLIRVLTHEIMNSVTPISSLTSTIVSMLENEDGEYKKNIELENEDIIDIHNGLHTIEKRSKGLLNFVDIYRNLTRIPQPNFRQINVQELLARLYTLLNTDLERKNINLNIEVAEKDLVLNADPELLEQILINLLVNAIDATEDVENPEINIVAQLVNGRIVIQVSDNGHGIDDEVIDKIFIPFFTTKKKGSGIGLSLSQQIMRLHSSTISVQSKVGQGTSFFLKF